MTRATDVPPLPSLEGTEWLERTETKVVLAAFEFAGVEARVVGGAVRNALLGRPVKDIDIATPALPNAVMTIARNAGLECVPTGIDHGTVTLIANHTPFEVTTLREDVSTDGRRATVAFTENWARDASRRDFTLNALYCDAHGRVFDPLGGYADLVARRVRFIGSPEDRIREDYLRILRFFRFTAEYADGIPDSDGLQAAAALKDGLKRISGERIRSEHLRLLAAPGVLPAVAAMERANVLSTLLGSSGHTDRLARLIAIESALDLPVDPLLRLAVLALTRPGDATALRERLKLSSSEFERLARMTLPETGYEPQATEAQAKTILYRFGPDAYRDGLLFSWAASGHASTDARLHERYRLPDRWDSPELPVRGQDLLALGVPPGPEVGRILRAFEEWWIASGFPNDPERLARHLSDLVTVSRS